MFEKRRGENFYNLKRIFCPKNHFFRVNIISKYGNYFEKLNKSHEYFFKKLAKTGINDWENCKEIYSIFLKVIRKAKFDILKEKVFTCKSVIEKIMMWEYFCFCEASFFNYFQNLTKNQAVEIFEIFHSINPLLSIITSNGFTFIPCLNGFFDYNCPDTILISKIIRKIEKIFDVKIENPIISKNMNYLFSYHYEKKYEDFLFFDNNNLYLLLKSRTLIRDKIDDKNFLDELNFLK